MSVSVATAYSLRREELARRVAALPTEVQAWQERTAEGLDMEVHSSQLQAIKILVDALVERQERLLDALDPNGDEERFRATALQLVTEIIKAQGLWDFFRDKLELRFSPTFADSLWVADTIAWDCYRPVVDRAVDAGALPRANVREPPLTYLTAEFSPATWLRGSRPEDGRDYQWGNARLPIPVIEIPWDHMGNLWELVSLHHEVAHDLEGDLNIHADLLVSLQNVLTGAGVPQSRVSLWQAWQGEVFADLVGLQLGGPPFALGLAHLLLLPAVDVTRYDPSDPHPTHWLRIHMNAEYMRTLVDGDPTISAEADGLSALWDDLYGEVVSLTPYRDDFAHVFRALMDSELPALKGKTVRQLVPYTAADEARLRSAADFLRTGRNAPTNIAPRLCVSAARLAASVAAEGNGSLTGTLDDVNDRLSDLVRANAAEGLRASEDSERHKAFIAGFAELL
jgi:hypothetical protein